jgi:hypothetical protein
MPTRKWRYKGMEGTISSWLGVEVRNGYLKTDNFAGGQIRGDTIFWRVPDQVVEGSHVEFEK